MVALKSLGRSLMESSPRFPAFWLWKSLGAIALIAVWSGAASGSVQDWVYAARPSGQIDRISPAGTIETFASGLPYPQALTFDPNGNLYVACRSGLSHQDTVRKISPDGQISVLASGLNDLSDIAFDPASGDLFASSGAEGIISRISPLGQVSHFASVPFLANGLAVDRSSNVFVATINAQVYRLDGSSVTLFAATNSSQLEGLTLDQHDNLFVTDPDQVWRISPAAEVSVYASSGPPVHSSFWYGLAFDSGGDLLVADLDSSMPGIRAISPSGNVSSFVLLPGVIDVATIPVPEPSAVAVLMIGFCTLARPSRCRLMQT
jgi:glucose/arabinose dehydrogenase